LSKKKAAKAKSPENRARNRAKKIARATARNRESGRLVPSLEEGEREKRARRGNFAPTEHIVGSKKMGGHTVPVFSFIGKP